MTKRQKSIIYTILITLSIFLVFEFLKSLQEYRIFVRNIELLDNSKDRNESYKIKVEKNHNLSVSIIKIDPIPMYLRESIKAIILGLILGLWFTKPLKNEITNEENSQ